MWEGTRAGKILMLRKGLLVAAASCWALTHCFMFKSNYQSTVTCVAEFSLALSRLNNLFSKCCFILGSGIDWTISRISCSCNNVTDALARLGSKGVNFIKYLWSMGESSLPSWHAYGGRYSSSFFFSNKILLAFKKKV